METLAKLFGSETKVKMMRLFLFNPEKVFSIKTIASRVKSLPAKVRKETSTLLKMKLIKRKFIRKKPKGPGFIMNKDFVYLFPLKNFLINIGPLQPKDITKKIGKLGQVKLVIISGIFIQNPDSRVDILIVGDGIKKGRLERAIRLLESEIGKELKYAYFSTSDFKYRLSMFDKLIRDILDYPHKKILNRLTVL